MAVDLERLTVSLEANLKGFEKAMAKANAISVKELRTLERNGAASIGRFEKTLGGVGASLKANLGLAVAGALAGLTAFAKSAITEAANIGDLADKIGLSTTELQGLQYGAVQANMSFEDLSSGLLKFSKTLGEARNGQGELLKTLQANGFTKAQIQALSYSDALNTVADLIKNAKNEQDALLINSQAFGKGNDGFLEFLRNGSTGLAGFQSDVKAAGAVIDEALIRKAQELDDRWAALMQSMKTQTQSAVLSIVSEINQAWNLAGNLISGKPMTGFMGRPIGTIDQTMPAAPPTGQVAAPGKTDLQRPTVIYDPQIDRDAAAATAAKAAADKAAAAAAKARAEQITNVIDGLRFEGAQLKTNELQQRINTELRNAEVTATSAQGQEIARLVTANYNLEASQRLVATATENYASHLEDVKNAQMEVARMGVDAFNRIAISGENVTDVLIGLVDQLAQAAVNGALLGEGPLGTLLGTSGSGGLIGSLLGGGGSAFAGLYAKGGQIPSGKYGIAGEAGPEIIRGPANVIPMNRMTGGGGTHVTIVQNIAANGDKAVADIAYAQTQRALRDVEMKRPQADVERRLRTQ